MTTLVYGFVRALLGGSGDTARSPRSPPASCVSPPSSRGAHAPSSRSPPLPCCHRERSGAYVARIMLVGGIFRRSSSSASTCRARFGFGALQAGMALLPMRDDVRRHSGRAAHRRAPGSSALIVDPGLATSIASVVALTTISPDHGVLPGDRAAAGPPSARAPGLAFGPLTTAGLAGVAPENAGAASGPDQRRPPARWLARARRARDRVRLRGRLGKRDIASRPDERRVRRADRLQRRSSAWRWRWRCW